MTVALPFTLTVLFIPTIYLVETKIQHHPCYLSHLLCATLLPPSFCYLQFATTDADTKAKIVQRGAVPPLIAMLTHSDTSLREMAAFALGRLAQNGDNQVGLLYCQGALRISPHPPMDLHSVEHFVSPP